MLNMIEMYICYRCNDDTGLVDRSILTLHATHRSVSGWKGSTFQLVIRQHYQVSTLDWQVDDSFRVS